MQHLKQLLFITILLTNLALAQQWYNVGSPGFSTGDVGHTSLAIDGNGTPYVAYQDEQHSNKATVMKYDGNNWKPVGNAEFSAGEAYSTSLAIDGNGTPYVAYQDEQHSNKATVMKYDGNNWKPVGNAGFSAGEAYSISLAIDGNGTPYVVYKDGGNDSKATVKKYNGSNWEDIGTPGFSDGGINYPSLAIDGNGTLYVAYKDYEKDGKAVVKKYNGSDWEDVGTQGVSDGIVNNPFLALDGNGTPYVAYQDRYNNSNGKATVMRYNGNDWVTVGNPGFSYRTADYISLAISGNGTPYVAYRDWYDKAATVMKYDGSSWEDVGNAGFSAGEVEYTSLAIANDGTPCVAYKDIQNGGKATVMSFGTSPLPVELTTFNAVINEKLKNIELNWQTATEVNNYGFEVERFTQNKDNNKWEKIAFINGHGNSNSPKFYNYFDNTVSSGKFQYRLKQIDFDGKYSYSNIVEIDLGLPTEFSLKQNYPNPFNPSTVIEYSIPSTGMEQSNQVMLKVYDILGKEVATLVNKKQSAGNYKVKFNANNLSNGVYFYKLTSGNYTATKKLMLMK